MANVNTIARNYIDLSARQSGWAKRRRFTGD